MSDVVGKPEDRFSRVAARMLGYCILRAMHDMQFICIMKTRPCDIQILLNVSRIFFFYIFLIFAQNIGRRYTSTYNLWFGAKVRTRGPMVL